MKKGTKIAMLIGGLVAAAGGAVALFKKGAKAEPEECYDNDECYEEESEEVEENEEE